VVDDESPLHEDFSSGYQHLALQRQMEEGLSMCGVPYRIHLLSDLKHKNFPNYKCYLFPNLFKIDKDTEALLHKKVLRNGNVAIFGPGTGIVGDTELSVDVPSRLFGVKMELIQKTSNRRIITQDHGHPMSMRLKTLTFGDSYAYGPLLVPADQRLPDGGSATEIGGAFYYYFFDRPGMFVNDFGRGGANSGQAGARGEDDYAILFTPAVPLPPEVLREAARYAGCHVWSEDNSVIYASQHFVSIHSARSGRHVLNLPYKATVWDMNQKKTVARQTTRLILNLNAPETRLYHLTPSSSFLP
jgi:hypothetical protein